ncbi:hypothetical protein T266_08385 [Pseudomonas aeruginosa VRFPA05]|nr:hypothetical protein T266_08385 [Pseudomonas aeruginosa VRFPA05]
MPRQRQWTGVAAMRIAVTLVLPILLILSLLGFDFLYSRHFGQERPAACAVGQACRIAP